MPEAVAEPPTETETIPGFTNLEEAFGEVFEKIETTDPGHVDTPEPAKPVVEPAKPVETPAKPSETPAKQPVDPAKVDLAPTFDVPAAAPEPDEYTPPVEPPKGKDLRAGWDNLRDKYETTKREKRQLESKARELEDKLGQPNPAAEATIAELRNEVMAMSAAVERTNLENHPAYRERFTIPLQRVFGEARQLLTDAEIDPNRLNQALSQTGKDRIEALNDLYSELPEAVKPELAAAMRDLRSIDQQRLTVLKNAKTNLEQLNHRDLMARHEQAKEYEQSALQNIDLGIQHLQEKIGLEVFKPVDDPKGDHWWNKQREQIIADGKEILLKTSDPKRVAVAALLAPTALVYRELFQRERTARLKSEADLKAIRDAEPNLRTGGVDSVAGDDKLDFVGAMVKRFEAGE